MFLKRKCTAGARWSEWLHSNKRNSRSSRQSRLEEATRRMSHWWPVQWSVVQKRCFHGAAGGLGEGPVLGCFCVRLLASWRSWFFVSLNFGGVCWRWLAPHLRAQNSPRLRKRCRQCTPTYLIMKVMSKTAFARAKVDSLAHAGTTCPSWHKLRLTCVHTGMLLHWSGPFLCDLGMAPSSSKF